MKPRVFREVYSEVRHGLTCLFHARLGTLSSVVIGNLFPVGNV